MNPVSQEHVDQVRRIIHEVLAGRASEIFLGRVDGILADWGSGKLSAAQACEKVQKTVSLFIDENLAKEIGTKCAPVVMREPIVKK
ncbi:MAG: hypothetical protein A2X58_09590 [Nitrospirae bacterium GWC2_56_14]|nr:MAG: hypothetical protein A2X58_09590 [Nitrospirae bacterium GWC2_56_14]